GAMEVLRRLSEENLRGVRKLNFDSSLVRFLEDKRHKGLGVNATFVRGDIGGWSIATLGEEFAVLLQRLIGFIRFAETNENLADVILRSDVNRSDLVRLEFGDFFELLQRVFELAGTLECSSELKADGIHGHINFLRALERLDGLVELRQAQIRA